MTDKTVHDGREMWKYGDAGDEYEVNEGDIWSVGPHHVLNGDLYDDAWKLMCERFGPPDMVYTDPPHGPAHEASYRTKAGLSGEAADFAHLMNKAVAPIDMDETPHLFVEAGNTDAFLMAEILEEALGTDVNEVWNITYYGDEPCKLLYFGPEDFGGRFGGMDDADTPYETMQAVMDKGNHIQTIGDPFTGKDGWTMRAAENHGLTYFGTELHPRRLARTLKNRGEQVGEEPELLERDVL